MKKSIYNFVKIKIIFDFYSSIIGYQHTFLFDLNIKQQKAIENNMKSDIL